MIMVLKDMPIQRKLVTGNLLTSGAVLLLTCLLFFFYELHMFRESSKRQLSMIGQIIATNSTAALAFESEEEAYEILSALKAEPHIVVAILYNRNGSIFTKFPASLNTTKYKLENFVGYRYSQFYLEGYQPVIQDGRKLGVLYLQSDDNAMNDRLKLYGIITISVIALSSLLAFLLSKIFQRKISQPIIALAGIAKAVSEHQDYSVRAKKMGSDELGMLTDAFNQMLLQIQEQNKHLSEFNKRLEDKVKERTIELEKSHEQQLKSQEVIQYKNLELAKALEDLQSTQIELIKLNNELDLRVTERTKELKKSEGELILKNDELRKINIDLDNFVYTASHDLKAPISNIEALTNLLKGRLDKSLSEENKKLLDMIGLCVQKFKTTIEDLTEITKVQKNREQEEEEYISIKEILEDIKIDINQLAVQSKVSIEEDFEVNTIVFARKNLRSIMYNILSNAIKYRSNDRPPKVRIKTCLEEEYVVLSIEDNGLGISKENHNKIFKMFKRLHNHVEGSGIGLYIIKRIIENRGGKIEVESELNMGSTFKVYFRK
jgi:signal transduction histidine kinase